MVLPSRTVAGARVRAWHGRPRGLDARKRFLEVELLTKGANESPVGFVQCSV